MIRIRTLLESTAAEKAKSMGLEPDSFGRWKKNGVVTHRTDDNGELVPVKSDAQSTTTNGPKPTGMSAQQAGTAASNVPSLDDMEKRQDARAKDAMGGAKKNKKVTRKDVGGADGENTPTPPVPPHNPFRPDNFHPPVKWGRIANNREEIESHFQDEDTYNFRKELVVGETVVIAESNRKFHDIIHLADDISPDEFVDRVKVGKITAKAQNSDFRSKLSSDVFDALIRVQNWWQESSQWERPEDEREQTNEFINSVCDHYKPAIQTKYPIERGMRVHAGEIEEFMSKLAIGKEIEMPPSGFSTDPMIARSFAGPSYNKVGVVMRIHPDASGKLHGIHLTHVDVPEEKGALAKEYALMQNEYSHEQEIIRPSGCKARCLNVTKIMSKTHSQLDINLPDQGVRCMYIVDMEELGYQDTLQESSESTEREYPIFDKYMNNSVGALQKSHTIKLKNMVNKNAIN